ncbi:MAG: PhoH family protein [Desulfuromonadales bacterium]|nr:PhoH family protein [Desulfuromonadales bacterium]
MTQKAFVLDTNVLLHDAQSIFSFQNNEVVIPLVVIEEMDRFKKDSGETGRNARQVARAMDILRLQGVLTNGGVDLESGGRLRVVFSGASLLELLPQELRTPTVDNQILGLALYEQQKGGLPVIVVTKDINLRIKAHAVGLRTEDYETDKVSYDQLYAGKVEVSVDGEDIDRFYRDRKIQCPVDEILPHQCVTLRNSCNPQQTAIGRLEPEGCQIVPLVDITHDGIWGLLPRNREQKFALDLLNNPRINLVTLVGKAGTGKTLLAIAAGLHCVTESRHYSRLLVSRPVFPMGRDLGFLPGAVEDKLAPWMQPIYDNVDLLLSDGRHGTGKKGRGYQELRDLGILEVEPLTYIRGRSIPRQFMIVDEAQNLTPHEVKTIITRAGEGTKVVLTGDPEQIDNPYIDASSNGLTYVVERFKKSPISGHITLTKGERSELAEAASNLL